MATVFRCHQTLADVNQRQVAQGVLILVTWEQVIRTQEKSLEFHRIQ